MLSALLFCGFLLPAAAHRFLFVSINIGHSHLAFSGQLADKLVEHGHEVDFMVSRMTSFVQGNGSRLANVFHFTPKSSEEINALMMQAPLYKDVFQHEVDIFSKEVMPLFTRAWELFGTDLLSDRALFERLKSRHYDAAISEAFDSCAQVLFHKLGIRSTMGLIPTPMPEMLTHSLGIPAMSSFVPVMNHSPERPLEMTFWERAVNFYNYAHSNYETLPTMNAVFDKPGPLRDELLPADFPSIVELKTNMAAIFLNTFELLDLPRPTLPHIRHVGGIALKQPKEQMDAQSAAIFANARAGVVILSFGSIVDTKRMSAATRSAFLRAFARFPDHEFVWKFVGEQTDELAAEFANFTNVHPMEWIDQTTMLAHPKTRAFLSHVGLNSLNEAAYFGVPVVACPFFGDQTYNTAIVRHVGMGVKLDKREITEASVTAALSQVLDDPQYRRRAQELSRALRNEASDRTARFVRDVEFATEFSAELTRQRIPQLNLLVFYSVDVIGFFFLLAVCALALFSFALSAVFGFAFRSITRPFEKPKVT
ncbi:Glucuronosyltransferase [Aphelenchoides fujianensis]|nr:Glucuronosyltransferase [Aphelenchoides fujianensis]